MNIYSYKNYKVVFFLILFSIAVNTGLVFSEEGDEASIFGADEKSFVIDDGAKQETVPLNSVPAGQNPAGNGESRFEIGTIPSSQTGLLFRIILSLAVIAFLAYIVIKIMKKASFFKINDDPYLKEVAVLNLSVNKSVRVITLGDKAYLIGISDSAINKLGEVEDKNLVDAMNLNAVKNSSASKKDFSSIFDSFFPFITRKTQSTSGSNSDFLNIQQERLKNIKIIQETEDQPGEEK